MEELNEHFWKRVDDLRGRKSMREVAIEAGIPETSIQSMRTKRVIPKMNAVYGLSKALNTTMEYLYQGEEITDNFDAPLFQKLSTSQELIDICGALITATPEDIKLIQRVLGIRPSTSSVKVDVTA